MRPENIISDGEALQILRNDLRKAALKGRAADLARASTREREKILQDIEKEILKELRHRRLARFPGLIIY